MICWKYVSGVIPCIHHIVRKHFDGLMQDCSNSIADAPELLQPRTKPSIHVYVLTAKNLAVVVVCLNST